MFSVHEKLKTEMQKILQIIEYNYMKNKILKFNNLNQKSSMECQD